MKWPFSKLIKDTGTFSNVEKKISDNYILANAWRLAKDVHLLFENKRYASALVLGCLSYEEVGKYLLTEWQKQDKNFNYDKKTLHKSKQAAVAALFIMESVSKELDVGGIDTSDTSKVIEAINSGVKKERFFSDAVSSKIYEYVKWSGMYYDEEFAQKGIEPAKITEDNAKEIIGLSARAFRVLNSDKDVFLAKWAFLIVSDPRVKNKDV